jgi:hypothetical protein
MDRRQRPRLAPPAAAFTASCVSDGSAPHVRPGSRTSSSAWAPEPTGTPAGAPGRRGGRGVAWRPDPPPTAPPCRIAAMAAAGRPRRARLTGVGASGGGRERPGACRGALDAGLLHQQALRRPQQQRRHHLGGGGHLSRSARGPDTPTDGCKTEMHFCRRYIKRNLAGGTEKPLGAKNPTKHPQAHRGPARSTTGADRSSEQQLGRPGALWANPKASACVEEVARMSGAAASSSGKKEEVPQEDPHSKRPSGQSPAGQRCRCCCEGLAARGVGWGNDVPPTCSPHTQGGS